MPFGVMYVSYCSSVKIPVFTYRNWISLPLVLNQILFRLSMRNGVTFHKSTYLYSWQFGITILIYVTEYHLPVVFDGNFSQTWIEFQRNLKALKARIRVGRGEFKMFKLESNLWGNLWCCQANIVLKDQRSIKNSTSSTS